MKKRIESVLSQSDAVAEKWLHLHAYTLFVMVAAACVLELAGGYLLNAIEGFVNSSLQRYLIKYIAIPITTNLLLALVAFWGLHSRRVSQRYKGYVVSLAMTGVCAVIYTIHNIFPALLLIFAVNIILTGNYGDYFLSSVVAVLCCLTPLIANFFIVWDSAQPYVLSSPAEIINRILGEVLLAGSYLTSLTTIRYERKRILAALDAKREQQRMQDRLLQDELTGLRNRAAFNQAMARLCEKGSGVLVMMDLDHFKQLNDTRGHLQGDRCLRLVAEVLRQEVGARAAFRYGGDEFCLVLEDWSPELAMNVCRRIQYQLEQVDDFFPLRVQASFGLAACRPGTDTLQLVRQADSALYSAKVRRSDIYLFKN